MPRETSYTNTRLKKKDGCRERPKWYKVEQPQQPGVPGNKQPGRCSRELWQMSCWAAKSYSQPPTHTDFSAQLMELMFMYQTHFWNPKKLGWLIWKYFLFTRSERVKYQQFHVLQPNLKQSLWSSSCNLSLICVIMKLFFWVPLGGRREGGTIPDQVTSTVWGSLPLINSVSKEGATYPTHCVQQSLKKGEQRGGTLLQVTIPFSHTWASHGIILAAFGSNYSSNSIPFAVKLTIYGGT